MRAMTGSPREEIYLAAMRKANENTAAREVMLGAMRRIGGTWKAWLNANPNSRDFGCLEFGNVGPDGEEGIKTPPDEHGVPYRLTGYVDLESGKIVPEVPRIKKEGGR